MLHTLSIQNLAIVETLSLSFSPGMTVFTGETGAGKSILIEGLNLALGERAETGFIRHGSSSAEITAVFDLNLLSSNVIDWLSSQSLETENECFIRRVLSQDGRSRAYINGHMLPISQIKELGEHLVHLHGQHQHQALLKPEYQRRLLDAFADHDHLCVAVKGHYHQVLTLQKERHALLDLENQSDKLALLEYQVAELDELNLASTPPTALNQEHQKLSRAEQNLSLCATALNYLRNDQGNDAASAIQAAITALRSLHLEDTGLNNIQELLDNALIQLEEGINELEAYQENLQPDPERLIWIDARLTQIHNIARKHRVSLENLEDHHASLTKQVEKLRTAQESIKILDEKLETAEHQYKLAAKALSESRQKAALQLSSAVTQSLHILEMPQGKFEINFTKKAQDHFSSDGIDDIEFMVNLNPGSPLKPLRKVASGGELSRISLAIQVITAQKMTTPTLIFDEVDVGISGKTAETVGKLLRQLGETTQVLCVTHLPQVASLAHHHFKVEKHQSKNSTSTNIRLLSAEERIKEVARMLGGATITEHAIAHAKDMITCIE